MTDFAKRFGARVRLVRTNLKITQKKLAEDAGLSTSFLSEVENGKRSISLVNAVNIAHALGVALSDLLR